MNRESPAFRHGECQDRELERIAGLVDPGWSDLEKAWYFHDYLTHNFTYDDEKEYHSAAMLFLTGKGVCESFSLRIRIF